MNRMIATTTLLLGAAFPAFAQQHHQPQPHQQPQQHPGQAHPNAGRGGMAPAIHPNQQAMHTMQLWQAQEHQMMLEMMQIQQQSRARKGAHEARKPAPSPSDSMTQGGGTQAHAGTKGHGMHGTGGQPSGAAQGNAPHGGMAAHHSGAHAGAVAVGTKHPAAVGGVATHHDRSHERLPLALDRVAINTLLQVHAKLRQADHDYNGNRVHAMHSVTSAIHHLGAPDPLAGTDGAGNKSQTLSDAMLRDSLTKLRFVESHLSSKAAPAHHAQARHEVAAAIRHLHTALQIN